MTKVEMISQILEKNKHVSEEHVVFYDDNLENINTVSRKYKINAIHVQLYGISWRYVLDHLKVSKKSHDSIMRDEEINADKCESETYKKLVEVSNRVAENVLEDDEGETPFDPRKADANEGEAPLSQAT
jgi:hypothetical protein